MSSPIASVTQRTTINSTQTPAPAPVARQKAAPNSSPAAITDTIRISSSALSAAQTALQEASESPVQTLKEANGGDLQARRLLARQTTK